MKQKGGDDEFSVADAVDDHAADDDAETEAGETGAADGAELRAREPEVSGPAGQDAAANAEPDAGGQNGQKAGPQETLGVRRDCLVGDRWIRHGCVVGDSVPRWGFAVAFQAARWPAPEGRTARRFSWR